MQLNVSKLRVSKLRATLLAAALIAALATPAAFATSRSGGPARAWFRVGAAKADITPHSLTGVYLGGYGIGPVHPAGGVLRHIYARAFAVADPAGHQVVIVALDVQGYFYAYQNGPYGIADIDKDMAVRLHIPAANILIQSTHTHNGPDALGIWGGVPASYLAYIKAQTESAIEHAVAAERPAQLRWATADMTGFAGTFGSNSDSTKTGDEADYPVDTQLRVLQAVSPQGQVTATLVNYNAHPTVYGPLDRVSPDWPGATATFLEHAEIGISPKVRYGYPGSVAVVTIGDVGHTWPAGTPRGTDPKVDPSPKSSNGPADIFGNAVARMAMGALAGHPTYLSDPRVGASESTLEVTNTNAALLALGMAKVPGYHILRANTPPYGAIDAYFTPAQALRIGDLPMFSSPGEPYPSIHTNLAHQVRAPVAFIFGLANDQLGYVESLSDYNGALQCSYSDEWFFTISPTFGDDLVRAQRSNAGRLGFTVTDPGPIANNSPGPVPPSTNCTQQGIGQL